MAADKTGRIAGDTSGHHGHWADGLLGNTGFRIRVAVTGTVLAIALFLTTTGTWLSDSAPSSFSGNTPQVYDRWNLWTIAAGTRGGYGNAYLSIDSAERGPAVGVAIFLIAAVVLTLVAAMEARWKWALAAGAAGVLTFVLEVILLNVGLSDNGDQPGPAFYKTGAGFPMAMWATGLLAVWAFGLAIIALRSINRVQPAATSTADPAAREEQGGTQTRT